ncbi:DNA-directed RNA polymerase subunit beta [Nocardia sp. NBC_01730]|uniref:DNA-directed RNA polymerase subunit beta n=1 Tax=Nocardia sp. NBC_01730 TaxID=2975998 RepID=UPI002E0D86C1|nr:DNA-directed RNA polymerase subunit beta [Nocardia sp. NBC_01730]
MLDDLDEDVSKPLAPGFADTPRSRCAFYRKVCQLPTVVDPDSGQITMRAGLVWGVMMPVELGQVVKVDMERRQLGGGPIVSHPRSRTWTFLTRSDIVQKLRENIDAELFRHRVTLIGTGGRIGLPSPTDRGVAYRAWITAAYSPFRPSGAAVVESIRAVIAPRRHYTHA